MFKKQKLKLTLLNTAVFFILFIVFNTVVYFYAKSNLYNGVDRNLAISRKIIEHNLIENNIHLPPLDPRVIIILRDDKGNIILDTHMPMFYKSNEKYIRPEKIGELYDTKFREFNFRTIAFSGQLNNKTIMVQLLRNTNSEKEFLDNLLKITALGGVIIFMLSLVVGSFLAQNTMIPIVNAWEKQRQFVEDASHELRTPLTVIQSQLELILRQPEAKVINKASYLGTALSETRRLSRLVADLLTLARSDSNIVEIEKKPIDIYALIKKVTEPYIEIADIEYKNIKVNLEENLIISCDEERIYQLIVILLDNALKYTSQHGIIEIDLMKKENKCNIIVKDNGIGIKDEEKELIFERFYRGDKSRTRKTGGVGLGLSIAKWIVVKHGGSIKATENIPKGTIIKVILPIN